MAAFGDCLVLHIQEIEKDIGDIDTSLFVLYDTQTRLYVIRGKRMDARTRSFHPYSFVCDSFNDLCTFVGFIICSENYVTYSLYNYKDLPLDANDITYEYLANSVCRSSEIAGYDNVPVNKKQMKNILSVLAGVFNNY
jgi:hypothetical protein